MHRLDARAKLLVSVVLASAAVVSTSARGQVVLLGLLLLGFGVARLPWQLLQRGVRGAAWLWPRPGEEG